MNLILAILLCLLIGFVYAAGSYWVAWWLDQKAKDLAEDSRYSGDMWV